MFCAFCEDRGLLPTETIRKAYEHRDPYHPRPIWDNFRGLFDSINRGNAALGIHAYNGGLIAPDSLLDGLQVSDRVCAFFRDLGVYDYRPASQAAQSAGGTSLIDVEILGHIFEQSISANPGFRCAAPWAMECRTFGATAAFGLMPDEGALMRATAPPRMVAHI